MALKEAAPKVKLCKRSCRWFTKELKEMHRVAVAKARRWEKAERSGRTSRAADLREEARQARIRFWRACRDGRSAWKRELLSKTHGNEIWRVREILTERQTLLTPPLRRRRDGSPDDTATSIEDKASVLLHAFKYDGGAPEDPEPEVNGPDERWPKATEEEVYAAVTHFKKNKAPGPDSIKHEAINTAFTDLNDGRGNEFHVAFTRLVDGCFKYGYHPKGSRQGLVKLLRKPGKDDYSTPEAYRPVMLLNAMGKIVEYAMERRLRYLVDEKLPAGAYGCRDGYAADDAILQLVHDVKTQKSDVVTSVVMLDIQGAFNNVKRPQLIRCMDRLGIPKHAQQWVWHFMEQREVVMVVDGKPTASRPMSQGIPQGSPVSPILLAIYTAELYEIVESQHCKIIGYVDDLNLYVHGRPNANTEKLENLLVTCHEWAEANGVQFDYGKKLGYMHLTNKKFFGKSTRDQFRNLKLPDGSDKKPERERTLLGIGLSENLSFRHHVEMRTIKAKQALGIAIKLAGTWAGMNAAAVRVLYLQVVRPTLEYGSQVWFPTLNQGERELMQRVQNRALRRILGAVNGTRIETLHSEAGVMPFHFRCDQLVKRRGLRIFHRVNQRNPLLKVVSDDALDLDTPIGILVKKLSRVRGALGHEERPNPLKLNPPWQGAKATMGCNDAYNWKAKVNLVKKHQLNMWRANYQNRAKENAESAFIMVTGGYHCTNSIRKTRLTNAMRNCDRRVVSLLVQARSNKNYANIRHQNPKQSDFCQFCTELNTAEHMLLECSHFTAERTADIGMYLFPVDKKALLGTKNGVIQMTKFFQRVVTAMDERRKEK
jgi:hypothetical protein